MSDINKLLSQLDKLVEQQDESKIGLVVERILAIQPHNVKALRCKVVLTIHQDKYKQTLEALDQLAKADPGSEKSVEYVFHRGYAAYRMLQYQEAKEVLSGIQADVHTDAGLAVVHLQAQIHYNLEEYNAAASIYQKLLDEKAFRDEQDEVDIRTNYAAVCAMIDSKKARSIVHEASETTYDMLYNVATAEVEAREYEAALKTLSAAESMCASEYPESKIKSFADARKLSDLDLHVLLESEAMKTNKNDVFKAKGKQPNKPSPERLFFEEVCTIWVQMAYVYYVMHEEGRAEEILGIVLRYKPKSFVILAVASINWTAVKRHSDFFDTHRKLKATQTSRINSRLTSKQRLWVRYNTALLFLNTGNLSSCKRLADQIAKDYPSTPLSHALLLAVAAREAQTKKNADNTVMVNDYIVKYNEQMKRWAASGEAQKDATLSVLSDSAQVAELAHNINVIAAQIFYDNGNLQRACAELQSLPATLRQRPGVVVTAAAWKLKTGDADGAAELVVSALSNQASQEVAVDLALWAAQYFSARGRYSQAVSVLKKLCEVYPSTSEDPRVAALHIGSLAQYNVLKAKALVSKLPAGSDAGMGSDEGEENVEILERTPPPRQEVEAKGFTRRGGGDGGAQGGAASRKKKKDKRHNRARPLRRPAKNMEGRLDPERWIAISLRTYIKDLPERRRRELKRNRAVEAEIARKTAAKRKAAAAAAAAATPSAE